MKQLLLLGIIFSFFKISAQTVNPAHHTGFDKVGNIVSIGSKTFYYQTNSGCCYKNIQLIGMNAAGDSSVATTLSLTAGHWPNPKRLFKTSDNCLVLFGSCYYSCDVGPGKDFFIKLDQHGVKQFETDLSLPGAGYLGAVKDIAQYSDSSYYLVSDSVLFHYSKTGQFVSRVNTGLTGINCLMVTASGDLLVNANHTYMGVSSYQNVLMSTSAATLVYNISNTPVSKFIELNGSFYGLTAQGVIQKYTSLLATGATSGFAFAAGSQVTDLIGRHDSIFVTGTNPASNTPFYGLLTSSLTPLHESQTTYKRVVPKGIALSANNRVHIITEGASIVDTIVTFEGYYQLPLNGNLVSTADVGVKRVSTVMATCNVYQVDSATHLFVAYPTYNLNVTVKNYGTSPVHGFYLNYYYNYVCDYLYHQQFTNTILPGDSAVVSTGTFSGHPFNTNGQAGGTFPIDFCLFTTVPDASNDINISNDRLCDTLMVNSVVGIRQNSLEAAAVSVFPNPFTNGLHISADAEIRQAEVYTLLGSRQQQLSINRKEADVDLQGLPAGVYFIKLDTEKGTVVRKIIKE